MLIIVAKMKKRYFTILPLLVFLVMAYGSQTQSREIAIRNLTKQVVSYSIKTSHASPTSKKMRIEAGELERFSDTSSLIISFESHGQTITYRLDPGMAYSFRNNEDGGLELYEGSHGRTDAPDLAPYVPTPMAVVEEMLKMASVTKTDILYDLGCGDGRIVITAARKYGTRGVGIDLDPDRIKESNAYAKQAGVEDLVEFRLQDVMKSNISEATVVTLYLLPESNAILRPILEEQLKPGARVVSHNYHMPDWQSREIGYKEITTGDGESHTIFVYKK
jgi:2-polyprenyl-3-methyl-5-hydroxy-6-metoxy-1,4-benzoquinol methylase